MLVLGQSESPFNGAKVRVPLNPWEGKGIEAPTWE